MIYPARWTLFVKLRDTPPTADEVTRTIKMLKMASSQCHLAAQAESLRIVAGMVGDFTKRDYNLGKSRSKARSMDWAYVPDLPAVKTCVTITNAQKVGTAEAYTYRVTSHAGLIAAAEDLEAGEAFRMAPDCRYTLTELGQADERCSGCMHRVEMGMPNTDGQRP